MAERGRPKRPLVVSAEQRAQLERWARRPTTAQALALRSRVVLACAGGLDNRRVAAKLGVHEATVGKWRRRFLERGPEGLLDEPRPGAPRTVTDEKVEEIVRATLEEQPADATHWSSRSMARRAGVSQSTVSRIWRAFALQPHRIETFKISTDPLFIEKVRDVVGLYLDPPERALVLCVDEKSQIQALNRSQPVLPILPGTPARRSHDYVRHGTTSLFAALDVASGRVLSETYARHRAAEFKKFLDRLDEQVPAQLDVHMILDNYATHKAPAIRRWLARHPRFVFHFLPKGASWLNLIERWFAELTTKLLQRGVHTDVKALEADLARWIELWNENPRPYLWVKTADEILTNLARYCQRISDSGH
jgi:transposase/AraC-like DNA-binding protein